MANNLPASQAPSGPEGSDAKVIDDRSSFDVVSDYVKGDTPAEREKAREYYRQADQIFREASVADQSSRRKQFGEAARLFRKAAKSWKSSALEEDALLMAGESYFFADRFPNADEAFADLLEKYPRSRHVDRIVSRRFEVAKYWIEVDKKRSAIMPVNFVDRTLPMIDIDGTGIKLLDQIRYDDPTGKLADDATMAAGLEYFSREDWVTADSFFSDLRETFPDSNHQFNAHLFGLKCKLEIYEGPKYSGNVLDEAEDLIKRMQRRFPQDMREEENRSLVAKSAAEIQHLKAERLYYRGQYREKRSENGSARFYYQQILDKYSKTSYADKARSSLQSLEGKPNDPPQRLAWLTDLFPSSEAAKPLMVGEGNLLR